MDVFETLTEDHRKVSRLFDEITGTDDPNAKRRSFLELKNELDVHTAIEEEIFYPALRQSAKTDVLVDRSLAEHKAIKSRLERMEQGDVQSSNWANELQQLKRDVEHHVQEEENEVFPQARENLSARIQEDITERVHARKAELTGSAGESTGRRPAAKRPQAQHQQREHGEQAGQEAGELARAAQERGRATLQEGAQAAAGTTGRVAEALQETGESLSRHGEESFSHYVLGAADRLRDVSRRLAEGDMDTLLRDANSTARQNPALLFGGAIATGFLISRFLKGSQQGLSSPQPGGTPEPELTAGTRSPQRSGQPREAR